MRFPFGRPYAYPVPTAQLCSATAPSGIRPGPTRANETDMGPPKIAANERRCLRRTPSRLMMQVRASRVTEEGMWLVTIRNISREGIGLTANRPVKTGMFLTIELPGRPPIMRKPILVRVTHAHSLGNGWWNVGGAFVRPLTKAELDAIRGHAPLLSPTCERRMTVRHTTNIKSACPLVRITEQGPWWMTIRNISPTGLGLIANRPFRVGTFLTLELPTMDGTLAKQRLLNVTHVKPQAGNRWWVLGGSLLSRLSKQEMAALS